MQSLKESRQKKNENKPPPICRAYLDVPFLHNVKQRFCKNHAERCIFGTPIIKIALLYHTLIFCIQGKTA